MLLDCLLFKNHGGERFCFCGIEMAIVFPSRGLLFVSVSFFIFLYQVDGGDAFITLRTGSVPCVKAMWKSLVRYHIAAKDPLWCLSRNGIKSRSLIQKVMDNSVAGLQNPPLYFCSATWFSRPWPLMAEMMFLRVNASICM